MWIVDKEDEDGMDSIRVILSIWVASHSFAVYKIEL